MGSVWFNVLTFLAEPHAVVDGAVEDWKICCEVFQQPCLLIRILDLEQLIEFLSRDFEWSWDDGDWREDGLVVRPYQEHKADVVEQQHEESFEVALDDSEAEFNHVSVPAPRKGLRLAFGFALDVVMKHYHSMMPLINTTGITRV